MTFSIVLLTTYMTISDCYDKINKRIERILLEAVHVFDKSVSVRARHDGKVSVYDAQRQMIHELSSQTNEKLLLIQRRIQTDHDTHITPKFIWVLKLMVLICEILNNNNRIWFILEAKIIFRLTYFDYEMLENIERILAIVFENACYKTRETNRLVPIVSFEYERKNGSSYRVGQKIVVSPQSY